MPLHSIMVRANPKPDVIIEMHKRGQPSKKIFRDLKENLLNYNPRCSMRKMAGNLGIGATSAKNIVRKKLNLRPFRMQDAHFLNYRMKVIRWQICKASLKRFAGDTHLNVVFSDEKIFTVDPVLNSQNDQILSRTLPEAIRKGKSFEERNTRNR
ncbi:hypothetical protein ANCDUO_19700 [Ancylostoma duodenale]|uniref:Transposase n=1 Tax=Ancylostoma duodenale TaxID=51022 RepID=A0A0C2C1U6_9BILA|nr:hypothetical protein ANCDUO_19700 [Ancylostoma duodenale]